MSATHIAATFEDDRIILWVDGAAVRPTIPARTVDVVVGDGRQSASAAWCEVLTRPQIRQLSRLAHEHADEVLE